MLRSLWSAATGMNAQQVNLDTIANNLANVNTTGYKTQTNEFKSLLYQTLHTATTTANGTVKPVKSQVGLGVRNASITTNYTQGALQESPNKTAFAINGSGFFAVRGSDGNTYYTRNGNFQFSTTGNGIMLCTTDGLPVLTSNGRTISLGAQYSANNITMDSEGVLYYTDAQGNTEELGSQIGVFQFRNPTGLEHMGDTLYMPTGASGQAINEATNDNVIKSKLIQGYLEMSNVSVADEMVNMITTQRAYELNSKAITTSDSMLETANNLKR